MLIIKQEPLENGAHANQSGTIHTIPDGWLAVPQELEAEAASYLPFIVLTVENGIITAVAQGEIPEPEPVEPQPPTDSERVDNVEAILSAMMEGIV